ncbi:MAG: response regulator, partial [Gemmatimonadaceae bacterium]|nr:response regulator [Gloeobacterales cyanobacterium ES-bin-141]
SDPRWHALPVLFLSAHTDTETMHRAFASGADDFISKTIAGPELASRILNRLDRCQVD